MKSFSTFVAEGQVREGSSNPGEARSLLKQGIAQIEDVQNIPLTQDNAAFRFVDAYEAVRKVLQAFLAQEGFKPYSHEAIIVYGFEQDLLTKTAYKRLDRYRQKRNDINYRAEPATVDEAEEIISFATNLISRLEDMFEDA